MCPFYPQGLLLLHQDKGHIRSSCFVVRGSKSLSWVPMMAHAMLLNPIQLKQRITASAVRARERQIRAPKKGIFGALGRGSYTDDVTVYPYNGYI